MIIETTVPLRLYNASKTKDDDDDENGKKGVGWWDGEVNWPKLVKHLVHRSGNACRNTYYGSEKRPRLLKLSREMRY